MKSLLKRERWSPYLVGSGLGILSWVTFYFMNKALGVSTTFVRMVGSIEALVSPEHVEKTVYLSKYLVGKPGFEWQAALVVFLVIGAFVAARLSGSIAQETVPSIWQKAFGPSKTRRFLGAFVGGVLLLFGARLAGGCTSGHGLSGGMQLAISGWVFLVGLFATGIPTAFVLYKRIFYGDGND